MIIIPIKPHLVDVDFKRNFDFWENCTYVDKMVGNELPGPTFLQICLWDMKSLHKLCVMQSIQVIDCPSGGHIFYLIIYWQSSKNKH